MPVTTFTSRELNQDIGRAKRATANGPVFITSRGKPTQVLLSFAEYERLTGKTGTLADALAMPGIEDMEFDPPRLDITLKAPNFDD